MGKLRSMKTVGKDIRPEELSSKEHGGLWPFKADLAVEPYRGGEPITYTMFFRAPNLSDAMHIAVVSFDYFEHERPGITDEYPRISDNRVKKSTIIGLDEDQYMEFWKEAQMAKHFAFAGNRKNPSWFRFVDSDDWHLPDFLQTPKSKTLYIPSAQVMSAKDIIAKKEAIDRKAKK